MLLSYEETIHYLYEQLPLFSRLGAAAYKADLKNTTALCAAFGNPERKFKSVHIAGTNGKGSTSHMLAAILHRAGYKTGLYTSPHLKDFRERIKISPEKEANGNLQPLQMVPKDFVVEFTANAQPFIETLQPSFFELTVVMAFEFFAQQNVDIAIIETGLGGRLDSTNVVVPELSIITNIGLDHTNLLGGTLAEIAGEKAGIIKRRVPVIIGEKRPATQAVFEQKAELEHAPLIWAEERMFLKNHQLEDGLLATGWRSLGNAESFTILTDLPGLYQLKNLATVLTAVELLQEKLYSVDATITVDALRQVKHLTGLHGRWEKIQESPTVVLDVAHNEDGIKHLVSQLTTENRNGQKKIHIVLGMVKDKAIGAVLRLFPKHYRYYFTQAQTPRALPAIDLKEQANALGLTGTTYPNVNEALHTAMEQAAPDDIVVVCGSVFLVGEVELPDKK